MQLEAIMATQQQSTQKAHHHERTGKRRQLNFSGQSADIADIGAA